jgi:hypothetical protein
VDRPVGLQEARVAGAPGGCAARFRPKAAQWPQLSRLDGAAQACAVAYADAVGEQLDPFEAKPGQREQLEQAGRCREILGLNPNTLASRMPSLGIKRKASD